MRCDFVVIGAGIAGASAAYELAGSGRVILLEREDAPGYHSSGRSAAVYTENYGNRIARALTRASRSFLDSPPAGFTEHRLLKPRGALFVATADEEDALVALVEEAGEIGVRVETVDGARARALVPVLRPEHVWAALFEPGSMDIDVHALQQGFLRGLIARGGELVVNAEAAAVERRSGSWQVTTSVGRFTAPVLVNAAGAWADGIARLAGVRPLGLTPMRRTALTFDPPDGVDCTGWPVVIDVEEAFYFKPDAGRLMASPADVTPVAPADVRPEELDIAVCVDRVEKATTLKIRRITHKWAGLRTFAADKVPAVGPDPEAEGFFWVAGQGGYGIMTSPAMARATAALATGRDLPIELTAQGLEPENLLPARLRTS